MRMARSIMKRWLKRQKAVYEQPLPPPSEKQPLLIDINENVRIIQRVIGESSDIVMRTIRSKKDGGRQLSVIYTDGLVDKETIQHFILQPLLTDWREQWEEITMEEDDSFLKDCVLHASEVKEITTFDDVYFHVLSGDTVMIIDGTATALAIGTRGWQERNVMQRLPSWQVFFYCSYINVLIVFE